LFARRRAGDYCLRHLMRIAGLCERMSPSLGFDALRWVSLIIRFPFDPAWGFDECPVRSADRGYICMSAARAGDEYLGSRCGFGKLLIDQTLTVCLQREY
jgi:hypothetical protein